MEQVVLVGIVAMLTVGNLPMDRALSGYSSPSVWMVLEGAGRITTSQSLEPVTFSRGQTLLMPAVMDEAKVLLDEDTVWLEITFPQAYKQQLA